MATGAPARLPQGADRCERPLAGKRAVCGATYDGICSITIQTLSRVSYLVLTCRSLQYPYPGWVCRWGGFWVRRECSCCPGSFILREWIPTMETGRDEKGIVVMASSDHSCVTGAYMDSNLKVLTHHRAVLSWTRYPQEWRQTRNESDYVSFPLLLKLVGDQFVFSPG